jgi:hypothetical protein
MKMQADQSRKDVVFNVGDYVYLKLQPYRQNSVNFRRSLKLSPRFFGPYRVLARVGSIAYRLELPVGSLIHDVFHVSLLKKHVGTLAPASPVLPPISKDSTLLPQPEAILDKRIIQKGRYRPRKELLVKWVGSESKTQHGKINGVSPDHIQSLSLRTRIFRVGKNDMDKQPIMHTCAMQRIVGGK